MKHQPKIGGYMTMRYVADDGSSGECLFESEDIEPLFVLARRTCLYAGHSPAPKNPTQFTADPIRAEQEKAHTFN